MLSAMDPLNSSSSCITVPIRLRNCAGPEPRQCTPPMRISPSAAGSKPRITLSRVVLPHPEGPTMATDSPSATVKLDVAQDERLRVGVAGADVRAPRCRSASARGEAAPMSGRGSASASAISATRPVCSSSMRMSMALSMRPVMRLVNCDL